MILYFVSAVLVHIFNFPSAARCTPQKDFSSLTYADLLPSSNDISSLVEDYVHIAMHVAVKHIPYFSFLKNTIPLHLPDEHFEQLKAKTGVILLYVLAKNEH
jgi:hypothetical protein